MRNGFSFKGVHSSSFGGVTVKTKDRPILPSVKEATYSADNMHGEYDFTSFTGEQFYNTRTVQLELSILADNLNGLQNKLSRLAKWLTGKGDIVFDDIPLVKWKGRVIDSIPYMPEYGGKTATLAVSFKCEPFAEGLWNEFDGPVLDTTISLDSSIMIGADEYLTVASGLSAISVNGDVPVMPVLQFAGGPVNITVTNSKGTYVMNVNYSGAISIDCERKLVYSENINLMPHTTGDFPVFMPDENNLISPNRTCEIHYTGKFLYNREV